MSEHECIVCGYMHDPERAEQAERALAEARRQAADDRVFHGQERDALRATLARVEGERDMWRNDFLDALDVKSGHGPTALSTLAAERDGLRAALRWMDEYVVPPEFPNEGDQQYWEELRAHYAALGNWVNNAPTGGV